MTTEVRFKISGSLAERNRTDVTRLVWNEATGSVEVSGMEDTLYSVVYGAGVMGQLLKDPHRHGYQSTDNVLEGVRVVKFDCALVGNTRREQTNNLGEFVMNLALPLNNSITPPEMRRTQKMFGLSVATMGRG